MTQNANTSDTVSSVDKTLAYINLTSVTTTASHVWAVLDTGGHFSDNTGFSYLIPESVALEKGGQIGQAITVSDIIGPVGTILTGTRVVTIATANSLMRSTTVSLQPQENGYWVMTSSLGHEMTIWPQAIKPSAMKNNNGQSVRTDLNVLALGFVMKVNNFPVFCVTSDKAIRLSFSSCLLPPMENILTPQVKQESERFPNIFY